MDSEIREAKSPPGQPPAPRPAPASAPAAAARDPDRLPGPPRLFPEWQLQRTKELAMLGGQFERNFRSSPVASGLFDQVRATGDSWAKILGSKISVPMGVHYHPASTQPWLELTRPRWAFLTAASGAAVRAASAAVTRPAWAPLGPTSWAGQSSLSKTVEAITASAKTIEAITAVRSTQWQLFAALAKPAWSKGLLDSSCSAGVLGIRPQDLQRIVRSTVLGDAAARAAAMRLTSTFGSSLRRLPNIAPVTPYTGIWPPSSIGPTPAAPAPDSTLPTLDDEDSTSGLERLLRTRIREIALVLLIASGACNATGVALLVLADEPLANILTVLFGEGTLLLAIPPSIAAIRQLRSSNTKP